MWIQSKNPGHANGAFKDAEMSRPVDFNENRRAQVRRSVGERLIEQYDDFEPTEGESGDGEEQDDERADDDEEN